MKTNAPLPVILMSILVAGLVRADVIISADFSDRTVSGSTASNIAWTTTGVTAPGDLIASASLLDTATTAGYFVPNSNVGNGAPWSTSIGFAVTGAPLRLTDIKLTHNVFAGGGVEQIGSRDAKYKVTITGSKTGTIGSVEGITSPTITTAQGPQDLALFFAQPLVLDDYETYTMTITASFGTQAGTFTGLKKFSVEGTTRPALVSADFANRSVSGATASNITWANTGMAASGSLTATANLIDYNPTTLGFFVPDANVGNNAPWSTSFTATVTGEPVVLTDAHLRFNVFSGAADRIQTGSRDVKYTVTVTGSTSGLLASADGITAPKITTAQGPLNLNLLFNPHLVLDDTETYTIAIAASRGTESGVFTGLARFSLNGTVGVDSTAPTPNPMTFAVRPHRSGASGITMTASTAVDDEYLVEYRFENLTLATDSGWQSSNVWTDTGLAADTAYDYRVTARDTSPSRNETSPTATVSATTEIALAGNEILAARFVNRTVGGTTVSNIDYLLNGVDNPGNLSVSGAFSLFNTADSQGFFAPVDNPADWSVNIPVNVGPASVVAGEVVVDFRGFNNSGELKANDGIATNHEGKVELFDASMISLGSQTIAAPAGSRHIWTGTFDFLSGTTLAAGASYTLRISVINGVSGNNVAIDNIRITPGSAGATFASWIGQFGLAPGAQGFSFDADGDGLANGVEAWFGTNPATGNAGLMEVSRSGNIVTFTHPVAEPPLTDVSGAYEWSLDLNTWNSSGDSESGATVTISASPPVDGIATVNATIAGTIPDRIFIRAMATLN